MTDSLTDTICETGSALWQLEASIIVQMEEKDKKQQSLKQQVKLQATLNMRSFYQPDCINIINITLYTYIINLTILILSIAVIMNNCVCVCILPVTNCECLSEHSRCQ